MKSIPLAIFLSCSLASSIAAAVTADQQINQTYNYEDGAGTSSVWAYAKSQDSTPSYQIINQGVVADGSIGGADNHSYQIDAVLDTTTYLYFQLPSQLALYGSLNLNSNIKVEIISGDSSKAAVRLGTDLNDPAFGINGNCPNPFGVIINGQWNNVGGDIMPSIAGNIQNYSANFAQSQAGDHLPYTNGPVLYIFNYAATSDHTHQLHVRITIDNVTLNGTVASMNGYKDAAQSAAQSYVDRIAPALTSRDQNITSIKTSIDNLQLSNRQTLYNQIETEASGIVSSHTNIVNSYTARTPLHVPTQVQYDQDINNANALNNVLSVGNYVASSNLDFLFYQWEATGQTLLNEQSIGVSSNAPQQTIQTTLALNELEPVSIALQNLFDSDITINQIDAGGLINQFGENFPADHIDTKTVKSWYVGSTSHINVLSTDVKTRAPMLLLKDDALVKVDDATKTNSLRINSQGTQFYQDISTTTAQMPNDAAADDSTSLQPFPIKSMQSKQLWLTLDTRTSVRPGNYSGSINVSYFLGNDTTARILQIPVSVFINPVQLQTPPLTYSVYYTGKIRNTANPVMLSDTKSQQQYLAEMQDMAAHGVTYPTQYIDSDTNQLAAYISLRAQLGMPCDKYFLLDGIANIGTNATTAYNNAILLKNTLINSSNCVNPQLYMYGIDEAQGSNLDAEKAAMLKIHEAGAKSFVAGYIGTYSHIGDALDTIIFSGTPDDGEISLWRNAGKDVYSYGNPQTGIPNPYIYRSHYGLLLWQHNYTGAMDYAYQDAHPDASPTSCKPTATTYCSMWNIFQNSLYYNHEFSFPTTSGVVDTIQWEGFREAVDDTRYLATLQTLAQSSTNSALASEISNWLATIKVQTNLDPIATRKTMQDYLSKLNVPPSITGTTTASGTTISISGQASDPEGYLGSVEVKLDSGVWINLGQANAWQTSFANVAYGNHTVYYRATDYWGAVTGQQSAVIIQSPQTITVTTAAPFSAAYGSNFTVAASASSGLPVTVSTAGGCANIGNIVTMTSGSTACTVNYDQAGDASYTAAMRVTNTTGASKANQTISIAQAAPSSAGYGSTFNVAATATSNLPVAITVSGGCSISGSTVTMTSASTTCKVTYNQAGDSNYAAATQVSSTTTAKKGTQTITSNQAATFARNTNMTVTATSSSGLTVAIAKYSGSCTKVSGGSGSIVMKMGALNSTCTLKYTQNGNTNYNAATNNNFTVSTTAK